MGINLKANNFRKYILKSGVAIFSLTSAFSLAQENTTLSDRIGLEVTDVPYSEAQALGWEMPRGAKVIRVATDGPAVHAGIEAEDILLSIDGQEIESKLTLNTLFASKTSAADIQIRLLREKKEKVVVITLPPLIRADNKHSTDNLLLPTFDTGGHQGIIRTIIFASDGKSVISAGDDKQIRVWDLESGKTARIIRGNVGEGREGQILAMALSPDGNLLAAAGWLTISGSDDYYIRLYDFQTGEIKHLFTGGHTDRVTALAFSPDGRHLLSGAMDKVAIIWDVQTGQKLFRLLGHTAEIYSVAFTADGAQAVTGSADATLRLWRVSDGDLVRILSGHEGMVNTIAINPSTGTIASGSRSGEVFFWDVKTGELLKTLEQQHNVIGKVVYSADGAQLLTTAADGPKPFSQRVFDTRSGRQLVSYNGHNNIVVAAAISPDGRIAATAGGTELEIHVWSLATGKIAARSDGSPVILRGTGAEVFAVGASLDNSTIFWGTNSNYKSHNDRGGMNYQLRLPTAVGTLHDPEKIVSPSAFESIRAETKHDSLTLQHLRGGRYGNYEAILSVRKNDELIVNIERDQSNGYGHLAYTFSPDGKRILSGGVNGHLLAYDLKGHVVGRFVGHDGTVWAVTATRDGRFLISGGGDETVRIWNLNTYELLATLLVCSDGEWIMWTPQGYYMGSPGADSRIGWQINRGPSQNPEYISADQLRRRLNRPDIVERSLILGSAEKAVEEAPGTDFKIAELLARSPPRFSIVSQTIGTQEEFGRAHVVVRLEPTSDPVTVIRAQVNGRQVTTLVPRYKNGSAASEQMLNFSLSTGSNQIRIMARNDVGETTETLALFYDGAGPLDRRGTLFVIAVGVDKYPSAHGVVKDLRFAGADARAFEEAVKRRLGPLHNQIVSRLLVSDSDEPPTASAINDALDLLKQSRENDTVVVYLAGHGENDGPSYRFLPTDAEPVDKGWRSSRSIPWYAVEDSLEAAQGRRLLFVDTCHSGNAYNQRLGNSSLHENIIAYSAARWDQLALENDSLRHGLFTYAVVEGFEGAADVARKREVRTRQLYDYIARRVDELAIGMESHQNPQYVTGRDAEDYVLAKW